MYQDFNTEITPTGNTDNSQNRSTKNNFYIFGNVDHNFPNDIVIPFIEEVEKQKLVTKPSPLNLYITSPGGYVKYGFDLIAHIERAKDAGIEVNTYVTSEACSCGSLIAVTGTNRYIGKRAYHLLHFMRGFEYAHNPIMLERNFENGKFWQKQLIEIYSKYTKITGLEEKLLADNYMVNGSKACIKAGLADFEC